MRLKTFSATYLLFLFILFSSLSIVSVYMSNSQLDMLKEKSALEYQTIAASLAKDIAVLYARNNGYPEEVDSLADGYAKYYQRNNIDIELADISLTAQEGSRQTDTVISIINREQESFIFITGTLPEPLQYYQLDYYNNISENMAEMRIIQNILLLICIVFAIISALALYLMLSGIFKPLDIVAKTSKKIAAGFYGERIRIKGKNEISTMAEGFNRMAEEIEKQIRLLENEAAAKQRFVDNFAHEIRTPLTSIYGYAEYMHKALLDEEEIIESAQFIMDEASHMKKIANSLLEFATLRQYTPVKNVISIPCLFEDIEQTMKKVLSGQNCQFIYNYDTESLAGQEDLIKSLLLNLCSNALKSCPPDGGIIHMEAKRQGEHVILSVRDNGCGIPEESMSKVTEPFYRVDRARSREYGGAGLGLTLCKQIAEAHGAQMVIESSSGEGTTVKIVFTNS